MSFEAIVHKAVYFAKHAQYVVEIVARSLLTGYRCDTDACLKASERTQLNGGVGPSYSHWVTSHDDAYGQLFEDGVLSVSYATPRKRT
jgi:hypothetical protein